MSDILTQSIVSFSGVIISVLIALYSSRLSIKSEFAKLDASSLNNYSSPMLIERIKRYPEIYFIISEMAKSIVSGDQNIGRKKVDLALLEEFRYTYDELNSKNSIFFSGNSARASGHLRFFLYDLIEKVKNNADLNIIKDSMNPLRILIGELEFTLRSDLGVYAIQLNDIKVLSHTTYTEVLIQIKKRSNGVN